MLVDASQAGTIRPEETLEVPVSPGAHTVQMAIDWTRSPALDVAVPAGETIYLVCAPNTSQSALMGATFGRRKYVSLWQANAENPASAADVMPFPWLRLALLAALLGGVGIAVAHGHPATAAALAAFALFPASVVVAWFYVRTRR
jgi:hypothetical protein